VPSPVIVLNVPAAGVVAPIIVLSMLPPFISTVVNADVPVDVTLPDKLPVTLPVNGPSNVPATKVSAPTVHLSEDSDHVSNLFVDVPLSISIPPSCEGVPVSFELRSSMLSSNVTVSELIVVVVPDTSRFPSILTVPLLDLITPAFAPLSNTNFSP